MKFIFLFLLFWGPNLRAQEFTVPDYSAAVVDDAQLLQPETRNELAAKLSDIYRQGGPQVAVLTIRDLNGVSIEEASIKTVDKWQLGRRGKDDGVLLFIAKSDRKMRIEVGRGLEGDLTDAITKLIIVNIIKPEFKESHFESGIINGVDAILQKVYPQSTSGQNQLQNDPGVQTHDFKLWHIFIFVIVFLFLFLRSLINPFGRRGSSIFWGGGGLGSGSDSGGGGFGGGSDSGGGGGFSGGGASGDW